MARGSLISPNDFGAVAVIDGTTVKITPLRTANVPPPMAMFEIEAGHTVIDVAFAKDNSTMAVLHHGGIDLYEWQTRNARSLKPQLLGQYTIQNGGILTEGALQICFASRYEPLVLYHSQGLKICRFRWDKASGKLSDVSQVSLGEEVLFTQANSVVNAEQPESDEDIYVEAKSGRLLRLGHDDTLKPLDAGFPLQLPWVETVDIEGEVVAFGLSRSGHLYANNRQLVKNCTSFIVTSDHLILTTGNHFLKFVHLGKPEGTSRLNSSTNMGYTDNKNNRARLGP